MNDELAKILRTAIEYNASDIFLSCGNKPTLRINGLLIIINELELIDESKSEEYLHSLANEDQINIFKEKNDIDFGVDIESIGRFRVNVFMQNNGPSIVMRPVPAITKSIDELNLPQALKEICKYKNGLVLLTGPTGCGKSTTLAAIINEINETEALHIITIEDPIEFIHKNKKSLIEQREVKTHTESFSTALRSALREDPDVILVGEMRDLETIALALTAAETGHLVIATMHTSGAPNTIDRIIDVFPAGQQSQIRTQLAMNLKAVIWQKLIPSTNGKSRIPALEIMTNTTAIANLIRKGANHQIYAMMETGKKEGMQTMASALRALAQKGQISFEELTKNISPLETDDQTNEQK